MMADFKLNIPLYYKLTQNCSTIYIGQLLKQAVKDPSLVKYIHDFRTFSNLCNF